MFSQNRDLSLADEVLREKLAYIIFICVCTDKLMHVSLSAAMCISIRVPQVLQL